MCVFCAFYIFCFAHNLHCTFMRIIKVPYADVCLSGATRPRKLHTERLQLGAGVQVHLESLRLALIWDIPTWNVVMPLIVNQKDKMAQLFEL